MADRLEERNGRDPTQFSQPPFLNLINCQVYTDPNTGAAKHKHKMGGSYPGNRRPQEQQYTPTASQFQNGQAVAHFVNYGGGNALVLQQNGIAQPQAGQPLATQPTYIQGRLSLCYLGIEFP